MPLSHPLLVEAIEQEFVPVLVYNNRKGADAEVLARYSEPAWNNPVVRFLAPDGKELLERADGVRAADQVAERLCAALRAAKRPVPGYLRLAREELARGTLERAVLSMPCFWRGESVLGSITGVRSTRAGWLDGQEVVDLEYDPAVIALEQLLQMAHTEGCATRVWVADEARLARARAVVGEDAHRLSTEPRLAGGSDHEHDLDGSPVSVLPLTPLQRVRVNARLGNARGVEDLLSPAQQRLLERVRAHPDRVKGLEPPADVGALWSYRARLEERLGR